MAAPDRLTIVAALLSDAPADVVGSAFGATVVALWLSSAARLPAELLFVAIVIVHRGVGRTNQLASAARALSIIIKPDNGSRDVNAQPRSSLQAACHMQTMRDRSNV